tara:strand:- start:61 stop:1467 length:1407 start_codon:yes stop_codon:yes gene_type:complete
MTIKPFLAACLALASGSIAAPGNPNVLFIIVDDLTTTLACQKWPGAATPNLDALAARGVRFDRAYCQFSVCNPARQSFLTGCYPQKTQVFDLSTSFRGALPEAVSLPQHFKNAGYRTGMVGKIFHVPDPKTEVDVKAGSYLGLDQGILDEEKASDATDASRGTKHGYNRPYTASDRPDEAFTDHQIANEALKAMAELKGDPFFLAVGFIRPHTPWVAPQWAFDAIDRDAIVLPPFYRGEGEDVSNLSRAALRPNNNAFRYEPATREHALDAQHAYLAAVHFVDHQIGRLMAELDRLGLRENTVIALTGDHGYHLGEHGLWAKQTLFEGGNHVPLLFAGPTFQPGISRALVEQVDIYPTLCELAELPIPDQVQGVSLRPWLEEPSKKSRIAAFSTMTAPLGPGKQVLGHSARNGRNRYIECDGGKSGVMLFDLIDDPDELHNLAGKPEHRAMERRLKRLLDEHLLRAEE